MSSCVGRALCLGLILASRCMYGVAQDSRIEPTDVGSVRMISTAAAEADLFSAMSLGVKTPPVNIRESTSLWRRMSSFYFADWTSARPPEGPAPRRGLEAPLDSPPFPSSDWSYGGSSAIGLPDANVYPTMSVLRQGGNPTRLYGWIETSGNASTSSDTNYPLTYGFMPNHGV